MSRLAESLYEAEFEREQDELLSEKAIMRECARQEYWANERLKRDKNRGWKDEDGEEY